MIWSVSSIAVPVSDLYRATERYEGCLGAKFDHEYGPGPEDFCATIYLPQFDEPRLFLFVTKEPARLRFKNAYNFAVGSADGIGRLSITPIRTGVAL